MWMKRTGVRCNGKFARQRRKNGGKNVKVVRVNKKMRGGEWYNRSGYKRTSNKLNTQYKESITSHGHKKNRIICSSAKHKKKTNWETVVIPLDIVSSSGYMV